MTPEAKRRAIHTKYRDNVRKGLWVYSDRYDAYYNRYTREWVEKRCKDRHCEYCALRPKLAPLKRRRPDRTA